MRAVHFGAGNIGRGFIGETLADNGFGIDFVDVNETIIDELNKRGEYDIELAAPGKKRIHVSNVDGINNAKDPDKVVEAIKSTDMITTAIGPKILAIIAPLIAKGLTARVQSGNTKPLDVIACENMIGGSEHLKEEVYKHLDDDVKPEIDKYIGFPNAAVDRIVPIQHNDDPLFVSVEDFKEWVIDESQMKNKDIKLKGVDYAPDLESATRTACTGTDGHDKDGGTPEESSPCHIVKLLGCKSRTAHDGGHMEERRTELLFQSLGNEVLGAVGRCIKCQQESEKQH